MKECDYIDNTCKLINEAVKGLIGLSDDLSRQRRITALANYTKTIREYTKRIREKEYDKQVSKMPAPKFSVGDPVVYEGIRCHVDDIDSTPRKDGVWTYTLVEAYGDGEHLAVPEHRIGWDAQTVPAKDAQFFHFVDAHDDDNRINIACISRLRGKEVRMSDGELYALTREQTDALAEVLDACRRQ